MKQLDADLLNFFEKFDAATINEVANIFYMDHPGRCRYDCARKKLKSLGQKGVLNCASMSAICAEKVYYLEKVPSIHDLYFTAVYSEIYKAGGRVNVFKKYPEYLDGQVKSDAFIDFEFDVEREYVYECEAFLEVDFAHTTDLAKYEKLQNSGCCRTPDIEFPLIIVITGSSKKEYKKIRIPVFYIQYDLSDFHKVIDFLLPDKK